MHAHLLIYRMGMHELQQKPDKVVAEASDYMDVMHPLLNGPHHDKHFILYMDQMPVYFTMNAKRTLEVVGIKSVHICTLTNDTKCVAVAITITDLGLVLPLMVIFKGKPNGCIARTGFADYPMTQYHCHDNSWMDEVMMTAWVDELLKPYSANAPEDISPS